uniref:Uncharacterized protein n=1 Tax=Anguilla anguilla TaxID=7936 RepID=A0A0E9VYZ2_ANGAN
MNVQDRDGICSGRTLAVYMCHQPRNYSTSVAMTPVKVKWLNLSKDSLCSGAGLLFLL